MSLRATEFEARVWRSARERMSRRPKQLAAYYRRRWGRWLEMCGLMLAGLSLQVPMFVVAVQAANGQLFPNGTVTDGMVLVIAVGTLTASLGFAWTWYHAAQCDPLWSIGIAIPFADQKMAWQWMSWRVAFAGVFAAPLMVFHAIVLRGPLGGWQSAMMWGTLIAVAELAMLLSTTLLLAVVVGKWLHDWRWLAGIAFGIGCVTLLCVWPIQFLPPRGVAFVGRRLLWWPTGWPLAAFDSVLQLNFVRATWWLLAVGVWSGAGLAAAWRLIQDCSIGAFHRGGFNSQLWPLFERLSVWGPVDEPPLRVLSKWEQALGVGQQTAVVDFVKLETSDEPLTAAAARKEVLRGEFLQPLADTELGWMEQVLMLSLFGHERRLAQSLLLDGRYWTRAVKFWWILSWLTALWLGGVLPFVKRIPGNPIVLIIPIAVITFGLVVSLALTTIWIVFVGWPGWIWTNSANKGLPIFAHLPISHRELSALRQRVSLLKTLVVLAVLAPVLMGISWMVGAALWPVFKVAGKLALAFFVVQSWWFVTWQLSGSIFRTLIFYMTTIVLLLAFVAFMVFFLKGDGHLEWAAPLMLLSAKLMTWQLSRTLDRPVFDLTGATRSQQHRGISLQLESPTVGASE